MTDKTLETLKALRDNIKAVWDGDAFDKEIKALDDAIKRLEEPQSVYYDFGKHPPLMAKEDGSIEPLFETVDLREMKKKMWEHEYSETYNQAINDIIKQHNGKVIKSD